MSKYQTMTHMVSKIKELNERIQERLNKKSEMKRLSSVTVWVNNINVSRRLHEHAVTLHIRGGKDLTLKGAQEVLSFVKKTRTSNVFIKFDSNRLGDDFWIVKHIALNMLLNRNIKSFQVLSRSDIDKYCSKVANCKKYIQWLIDYVIINYRLISNMISCQGYRYPSEPIMRRVFKVFFGYEYDIDNKWQGTQPEDECLLRYIFDSVYSDVHKYHCFL